MKNEVITILSAKGIKTTYLFLSENDLKTKTLYQLQHKTRVKQILYGGGFTYYSRGMDFAYALSVGCKILTDNRKNY